MTEFESVNPFKSISCKTLLICCVSFAFPGRPLLQIQFVPPGLECCSIRPLLCAFAWERVPDRAGEGCLIQVQTSETIETKDPHPGFSHLVSLIYALVELCEAWFCSARNGVGLAARFSHAKWHGRRRSFQGNSLLYVSATVANSPYSRSGILLPLDRFLAVFLPLGKFL